MKVRPLSETGKAFIASIAGRLGARLDASSGIRVLLYHAIGPPGQEVATRYRIPVCSFEAQMALLAEEGYSVVDMDTLVGALQGKSPLPPKAVCLTFDDGYRSVLLHGFPVTRKFGYPATVYVVTDFCLGGKVYPATILEDEEPLCPEELRFLKSEGWSIGSHSRTHRRLARCPLDSAVEELLESRVRLSEALGAPTDHFSFPHGSWSWRLVDQLGKAGYRSGATSVEGINRVGDSPWLIKRIEVTPWDDLDTFRRKLLGWYDWLGWIRRVEAHDNA